MDKKAYTNSDETKAIDQDRKLDEEMPRSLGAPDGEDAEEQPGGTKKRRFQRKPLIALSVIMVVLVATGAGFWGWHKQPSFCSALCHSPMDPYVEGYFSENQTLSVVAHQTANVTCLQCHEARVEDQVKEAVAWVSGNFSDPLTVRRFGTVEFCDRCHNDEDVSTGTDRPEIIATTANYQNSGRNPHDSHLGNVDCYTCHSMHGKSKLYCTQCHDNVKQPNLW